MTFYLSVVSLWETILKYQLGKLPFQNRQIDICPPSANDIRLPTCPWMKPVFSGLLRFHRFTVIHLIGCWYVKR